MSLKARRIAQTHKVLGLVVGLQLLFWTASGLFFTLFPIEQIRGEHLRAEPAAVNRAHLETLVPPQLQADPDAIELRSLLGRPVWEVRRGDEVSLYEAATGEALAPLGQTEVQDVAQAAWAGEGAIKSVEFVEHPPREAFTGKPLWRVQFDGQDTATFWVDADAGEVVAVRTGKWRVFDVLWRFHIMDVTGADRFDSWWLKLFAFLGLSTVLFGIALLVHRASKGRLLK